MFRRNRTLNYLFCNRGVVGLISFGLAVHFLVLQAAFDIYFSSPIDHGMTPIKSTENPPAKRVVFIVADGLRSQAIFEDDQDFVAPNLNEIRRTRGSWGISRTRVPTESRPGHVALLGGIYEDPSAILKGWKINPVDFDSVINQSTNAWCWGGPSIVNMFNRDNLPHIHLHSYDPQMEDFGNNNTIGLDAWVFQNVEQFIRDSINCQTCTDFRKTGNLFFLHLLGTDTAGHAFKPTSEEYTKNIQFVDSNIPEIESWFEAAFPDETTAFVFTADHGMSNWGSHGAGSDHETATPLIAWGAGIRADQAQKDVAQIDIAPLLSALIGNNYPINSQGRLPVSYIDASPPTLAEMLLSNTRQLMEIFNIKRLRRMFNALRFVPYQDMSTDDLNQGFEFLQNLSSTRQYEELHVQVPKYMDFLIQGADYYHNYYQAPLLISITIGMVCWIIYLSTLNVTLKRQFYLSTTDLYFNRVQFSIFIPVYINMVLLVKVQSLPFMYYCYFLFPVAMIQIMTRRYKYILAALRQIKAFGIENTVIHGLVYIFGLRLLVQTFQTREVLSLIMFLMTSFVFWSKPLNIFPTSTQKVLWAASCIAVSLFVFSPVMQTRFNRTIYLLGFGLWWSVLDKFILKHLEPDTGNVFLKYQHIMYKVTPLYTLAVDADYVPKAAFIKIIAFLWSLIPILLIPFSPTRIYTRVTSIFLGFSTYYLMVSSTFEVLFLTCYVILLFTWMKLESKIFGYATIRKKNFVSRIHEDKNQTNDDFRRAFFFITLIFMGFFGTGNIASVNSFDPMWVRCFLTVFSPFKMSALILLKIMVPFIFVSCVYRAINLFRSGNTLNTFCVVLMFSDIMLLELLYSITNIGSWLEIGMSLSHFIIMESFVVILLLLYGFAYLLTTKTY